ncbi:MAG: VPLPA-CTERM sorting domain-containing protein, partial [Gammaproteobacteria bacterium]|nr:VPLPA-CTERM sorting domain-containing protein [Gammaproteobacteria bacterium]
MNNKKIILTWALLIASITQVHAAILSQTCVDSYDDYGYYDGYSCDTSAAYTLDGTMTIRNTFDGSVWGVASITGTMTQNSWYTESFSMGSSSGETATDLSITASGFGVYTMSRLDWLLDGGVTTADFAELMTGSGYTLSGPTDWLIEADGTMATIRTLDADGDGINGINLLLDGELIHAVDIELTVTAVPVPAAIWLFGSGLIGLAGFAR